MKNKKIIIISGCIILLLLISLVFFYKTKPKNNNSNINEKIDKKVIDDNKKNVIDNVDESTDSSSKEEIKNENKEESKKEIKEDNNKNTNTVQNNVQKKNTNITNKNDENNKKNDPIIQNKPEPVEQKTISYSCPDGYTLNDKECSIVVDANYVCPLNTTDYESEGLQRNTYCVNLSDGYITETESCPNNYGIIAIYSFGEPTKYKCLVLHKRVYTCDDGYSLNGNKCSKVISATINE